MTGWTYPKVPIALLKGLDLRTTSGVRVPPTNGSSAASSNESMLRVLSDIPHAEVCFAANTGVADTKADRYFSCNAININLTYWVI